MIYAPLNQIEQNLHSYAVEKEDYELDWSYRLGYDDAWRIATNITESSVWRTDPAPYDMSVLVYIKNMNLICQASQSYNHGWSFGVDMLDEYYKNHIDAWMYLPCPPAFQEKNNER